MFAVSAAPDFSVTNENGKEASNGILIATLIISRLAVGGRCYVKACMSKVLRWEDCGFHGKKDVWRNPGKY